MQRFLFFVLLTLSSVTGCKSSTSKMVMRDENNQNWESITSNGIPITLKVPTHVKLYVYNKHFMRIDQTGGKQTVEFMTHPPMLDFAQEYLYTEKIVMVDFKRPAAGAFNLDLELSDDQYIKRVQQDITDETIARVGEFVQRLGAVGLKLSTTQAGAEVDSRVKEVKSVLAVGVFDIDDPDFEQQVMDFLDIHLNQSQFARCRAGSAAQRRAAHEPVDAPGIEPFSPSIR